MSFDSNPADRRMDRLLAYLGMLDDAAPLFPSGAHVPHGGVLLARPALVESGIFTIARKIYGSIGPAFYGLRTTFITLLLMALLRIKRPEALKAHSPEDLGRILGRIGNLIFGKPSQGNIVVLRQRGIKDEMGCNARLETMPGSLGSGPRAVRRGADRRGFVGRIYRMGAGAPIWQAKHPIMTEEQQELLVIGRGQAAESSVGQKKVFRTRAGDANRPALPPPA